MLPGMSDLPARSSAQKRRSFLILVAALVVAAIAVTFVLSRGGDDDAASPSPSTSTSASPGQVTLATACAEIAPDMPNRVDALQRTAEAVRADIADDGGAGQHEPTPSRRRSSRSRSRTWPRRS